MNKLLKYSAAAIFGLMMMGCDNSPDPVLRNTQDSYFEGARQNFQKQDTVVDFGVREFAPGIYFRKFIIAYDTIYMRCDKDGNPLKGSEDTAVNFMQGKVHRQINVI